MNDNISKTKRNDGFTLVELIVVIVILAILIGVTIGGIYRYVGQARINTDINNASTVDEVMSVAQTDEELYALSQELPSIKNYYIEWGSEDIPNSNLSFETSRLGSDSGLISVSHNNGYTVEDLGYGLYKINTPNLGSVLRGGFTLTDTSTASYERARERLNEIAMQIFTNGLPKSQSGATFLINCTIGGEVLNTRVILRDANDNVLYGSPDDESGSESSEERVNNTGFPDFFEQSTEWEWKLYGSEYLYDFAYDPDGPQGPGYYFIK